MTLHFTRTHRYNVEGLTSTTRRTVINLSLDSLPEDSRDLVEKFTFNPELKEATLKLNGVHKEVPAITFPIEFDQKYGDDTNSFSVYELKYECLRNLHDELNKYESIGNLDKESIELVLTNDNNIELMVSSIKQLGREIITQSESTIAEQQQEQKEGWENDYYDVWGRKVPEQEKQQQRQEPKDEQKDKKREIPIYKYSQLGKSDLHEAVIIDGLPYFIKYRHKLGIAEVVPQIEENSRVLRPSNLEEYPYKPYEFESEYEFSLFMQKAKQIKSLDQLYSKCKSIFLKYIDHDDHVIVLLTADSIWTWFQDLFSTTHYLEGVGTNDVGKSSIGYTFEYTGYRVIKGTDITGANYKSLWKYRIWTMRNNRR